MKRTDLIIRDLGLDKEVSKEQFMDFKRWSEFKVVSTTHHRTKVSRSFIVSITHPIDGQQFHAGLFMVYIKLNGNAKLGG